MRVTVLKRSEISSLVRSAKRGCTRIGETRMWPGRRGLRFTMAKEWVVQFSPTSVEVLDELDSFERHPDSMLRTDP